MLTAIRNRVRLDPHADDGYAVTVFMMGITLLILFLGLMVVDAWRVLGARRILVSQVDATLLDATSMIDTSGVYASPAGITQGIRLSSSTPQLVRERLEENYTVLDSRLLDDGLTITASVSDEVDLIVMRAVNPTAPSITVSVTSTASAVIQDID